MNVKVRVNISVMILNMNILFLGVVVSGEHNIINMEINRVNKIRVSDIVSI
jgi:hypothetical protein